MNFCAFLSMQEISQVKNENEQKKKELRLSNQMTNKKKLNIKIDGWNFLKISINFDKIDKILQKKMHNDDKIHVDEYFLFIDTMNNNVVM